MLILPTKGFTLIEVLIALAIFALLAVIATTTLKESLYSKTILFQTTKTLHQLQLSITLLSHDIQHATNRAIRGEEGHLFPPFIGQPQYMELTYSGRAPLSLKHKSSRLLRIAYLCQHGQLIRRLFHRIDRLNSQDVEDELLLSNLTTCRFAYLNAPLQVLPLWRSFAVKQTQQPEPLPKAVRLTLTIPPWGNITTLFPIAQTI